MKCPQCGARNRDTARYCCRCRARLSMPRSAEPRHASQSEDPSPLEQLTDLLKPAGGRRQAKPDRKQLLPVLAGGVLLLALLILLIVLLARCSSKKKDQAAVMTTPEANTFLYHQVTLEPKEMALGAGETGTLTADGISADAVWTSSDPSIAVVNDGIVSAIEPGNVEISVSSGGYSAVCKVHVSEPLALTGFPQITNHVQGKGHRLEGVVTSLTPLKEVRVVISGSGGVEVDKNVVWDAGTGPLTYDFNDENKNLNQMVSFKSLTLGIKTLTVHASSEACEDTILTSCDFEVFVPSFPYASALDPDAYPCLMPEEWGDWLKADNTKANIDPVFAGRLAALGKAHNKKVVYISGFRTRAKQEELYKAYQNGTGNLAAKPGSGWHEFGGAVDASDWVCDLSEKEMNKFGLCKPVNGENWHVQPIEVSSMNKENFYNSYSSKKYPEWSKNCYMTAGD